MRDLIDQNYANWIITYQNMEKEWWIQALCGDGLNGVVWKSVMM